MRHGRAALLGVALAALPALAWAQYQSPASPYAAGGSCTGSNFAWPDANGHTLHCVSSLWVDTESSFGLSGGTTNYLAKWTSTTAIGTSILYDSGTNIGIGTASPGTKLEINATNISTRPTTSYETINSNFGSANLAGGYDSLVISNGGTDPTTTNIGPAIAFKSGPYGQTASYSSGRIYSYYDNSGGYNPGYQGAVLALQYPTADNTFVTGLAVRNGNVGINSSNPQSMLTVYGGEVQVGSSGAACNAYVYGAIRYSGNSIYYCGTSGWTALSSGTGSGPTGSGTANYVARWTGAAALGTGLLYDNTTYVGIGTSSPDAWLSLNGQAARTIDMTRDYTAATAGNNLTVQAGGAAAGATDKAGGSLILSSGITTGTGSTSIQFQTYPPASSSGSADDTATTALALTETGTPSSGQGTLVSLLQATTGSGTDKNGGSLMVASGVSTGTGLSNIYFKTYAPAGSSSSAVNAGTTVMTVMGSGAVGIGTATPEETWEAHGGDLLLFGSNNNAGVFLDSGGGNSQRFNFQSAYSSGYISQNADLNGTSWLYDQFGTASQIQFTANGGINFNTTNGTYSYQGTGVTWTTMMALTQAGGVGIGTATVANKLDVNGAASIGYVNTTAPTNGLIVGGTVGIGTATPLSKLHVYGGEVQVGSSGTGCGAGNAGAIRYNNVTTSMLFCNGSAWSPFKVCPLGSNWTEQNLLGFNDLAVANNGTTVIGAGNNDGYTYLSTDGGTTFTKQTSAAGGTAVAISTSGATMYSAENGGYIYVSTNSGSSWTQVAASRNWQTIATSADGTKAIAADSNNGYLYLTTNSGSTWTQNYKQCYWQSVAMSSDGTKLAAVCFGDYLYQSSNSGSSWTQNSTMNGGSGGYFQGVRMSADGTKIIVSGISGSHTFVSTNSGGSWSDVGAYTGSGVAMSSDGSIMGIHEYGGRLWVSPNTGSTFTARSNASQWGSMIFTPDGTKIIASSVYPSNVSTADSSCPN